MLGLPIWQKLFSFIRNLRNTELDTRSNVLLFFQTIIDIECQRSYRIGLQSMGCTKKSERSKRSEGSGTYRVKTISRGSSLFSFVLFLASPKVSSQEQASAVYKRCEVFILWKIVEVLKYYFKCR